MFRYFFKFIIIVFSQLILLSNISYAETIKDIKVEGNNRVSDETIIMFSSISLNEDIKISEINNILKKVYESNFFDDVTVEFENGTLRINVSEKPIILDIEYKGIKSKELIQAISENRILKPRISFDENSLKNDNDKILLVLRDAGYYFAKIESNIEFFDDDKINIAYQIDLGDKSKIKKISFIGDKVFKDKKFLFE